MVWASLASAVVAHVVVSSSWLKSLDSTLYLLAASMTRQVTGGQKRPGNGKNAPSLGNIVPEQLSFSVPLRIRANRLRFAPPPVSAG